VVDEWSSAPVLGKLEHPSQQVSPRLDPSAAGRTVSSPT
jgi:hypothetical protein